MVGRPTRRSGSGQEALPEVQEWSVDLPGGPGVVESGRETIPEVREWSGGPPKVSGLVGRPLRKSESGH